MTEYRINHRVEVREDQGSDGTQWWIRPLPYLTLDSYKTDFAPGVFAEELRSDPPSFLYGHNYLAMSEVLGAVVDFNDTDEALDLLVRLSDPEEVPSARAARAHFRNGALRRFSVGFDRYADEPHPTVEGALRITKGKLGEVSSVIDPAVPGTRILAGRSGSGLVSIELVREVAGYLKEGIVTPDQARGLVAQGVVAVGEVGSDALGASETPEAADDAPTSDASDAPGAAESLDALLAEADAALDTARSR